MKRYEFIREAFITDLNQQFARTAWPVPSAGLLNIADAAIKVFSNKNNANHVLSVLDITRDNVTYETSATFNTENGTITTVYGNKHTKQNLIHHVWQCEPVPRVVSTPRKVMSDLFVMYPDVSQDGIAQATLDALGTAKGQFKNILNADVRLVYENEILKVNDTSLVFRRHFYVPSEISALGLHPALEHYLVFNAEAYDALSEKYTDMDTYRIGSFSELVNKIEAICILNKSVISSVLKKLLTTPEVDCDDGNTRITNEGRLSPTLVMTTVEAGHPNPEPLQVRLILTNDVIEDIVRLNQGAVLIQPDKYYTLPELVKELIAITGASATAVFKYQSVINRALQRNNDVLLDLVNGTRFTIKIFFKYRTIKLYQDNMVAESFCLDDSVFAGLDTE